jgi:predicted nucleic acid-binding protein
LGNDVDDSDFVTLTKYLKGKLWTGDKILYDGLKNRGFKQVLNTTEIAKLWSKEKNAL